MRAGSGETVGRQSIWLEMGKMLQLSRTSCISFCVCKKTLIERKEGGKKGDMRLCGKEGRVSDTGERWEEEKGENKMKGKGGLLFHIYFLAAGT